MLQGEALEGESAGVRASEDGEVNVMKTGNDRNEEEDSEGVKDDDDEEEARQAHVTAAKIAELKVHTLSSTRPHLCCLLFISVIFFPILLFLFFVSFRFVYLCRIGATAPSRRCTNGETAKEKEIKQ